MVARRNFAKCKVQIFRISEDKKSKTRRRRRGGGEEEQREHRYYIIIIINLILPNSINAIASVELAIELIHDDGTAQLQIEREVMAIATGSIRGNGY
jgi:hypothetical protein